MAGIRAEQRLGQKSPLHVSRGGRELVEAAHPAEASAANLASMGQLKVLALKAVATRRSGGRQTKVEAAQYCKKNPAILAHSDDRDRAQ